MNHHWIGRTLRTSAWAPVLVVAAYALGGVMLGPVAPWWLDSTAHAAGGGAMAYFCFTALTRLQDVVGHTPRAVRLVAAVGLAAIVAIAWELLEFLVDAAARTRLAPSVDDTLLDLALGLSGAFVYALATWRSGRARDRLEADAQARSRPR